MTFHFVKNKGRGGYGWDDVQSTEMRQLILNRPSMCIRRTLIPGKCYLLGHADRTHDGLLVARSHTDVFGLFRAFPIFDESRSNLPHKS